MNDFFQKIKVPNFHSIPVFVNEPKPKVQEIIFDVILNWATIRFGKNGPNFWNNSEFIFKANKEAPTCISIMDSISKREVLEEAISESIEK